MAVKYVDGLINPRIYRKLPPKPRYSFRVNWRKTVTVFLVGCLLSYGFGPTVKSIARQVEVFQSLTNGRYLVLFQNDAEIRSSGGFIGSFAIIEAKNNTIKPIYFETNIYKLDDPFNQQVKIDPPKPLLAAIGNRGWGLRDANFAADFRQAAPAVEWFFEQEAKSAIGPKKGELDAVLAGNYQVDGVVATNLSAFLDLLDEIGPVTIPDNNIIVNSINFSKVVQQVVEKDYFIDPINKNTNEPKTILQNLFPIAIKKAQGLSKPTQYKLLTKLFREKKVVIYSNDQQAERKLIDQGWAGALELPADQRLKGPSDFLAVVRSSHGGNKSSLDINPIYRYTIDTSKGEKAVVKLEITLEHTGTGDWPSGVNHEYIRTLVPNGAQLTGATRNGDDASNEIDIGKESDKMAFGFWLHTQPKSSQTVTLQYQVPVAAIKANKYQLTLFKQPGGNAPDMSVIYNGKQLFSGRLIGDRVIE